MKPQIQINVSASIDDINYGINPISNSADEILGYDCELKVETDCGTIYLNIENTEDLTELIEKLQDIYSIWKSKEVNVAVNRWLNREIKVLEDKKHGI